MPVKTVSIIPQNNVVIGAHGVPYVADMNIAELGDEVDAEWLILPGGMPGATNLLQCVPLTKLLTGFTGNIAAICASPAVVLGGLGLLNGKKATCYPGMESMAPDSVEFTGRNVERDGRFITGRGPAWASAFAAAIVEASLGKEKANEVLAGMLYK